MAYFLKQTKLNGRTYLSIVESFYDPNKKGTAHKTYKSLKSIQSLIEAGIPDPVAHFQKEVDKLNNERKVNEANQISETSSTRYLGYFPIKAIMEKLNIKRTIDYFKITTNFDFDLYDILSSLVYARVVKPCSKYKTFHEVIPYLFEPHNFSYDQLLTGLKFYGNDYEKFVELFTTETKRVYGLNTSHTYFDCTNFYFEIDREDDFRRKGPSKENRKDPIVGLGLLLDSNLIPIGMKMYPGNESEKPIMRDVVSSLKKQNNIDGKTIHVADKGLNCAANICFSRKNGDGYLFSKSVKQLPETEKVWVLLDKDYKDIKDKDGKLLYRYKSCIDKFPYSYTDDDGKTHRLNLTEKRVVTYNPSLAKKKISEIDREVEKARDLCLSQAKRDEFGDSGKYVTFSGEDGSKVTTSINTDKIEEDKKLAGYNLLVTSETKMKDEDIYNTYHNLWRIEESFKVMKSDLDARPVFAQTEESIKGHFLICYIAVLLERIFQFIILKNQYSSSEIYGFMKDFTLAKHPYGYINLTASTKFIRDLADITSLPITNLNLTDTQIKKILSYRP